MQAFTYGQWGPWSDPFDRRAFSLTSRKYRPKVEYTAAAGTVTAPACLIQDINANPALGVGEVRWTLDGSPLETQSYKHTDGVWFYSIIDSGTYKIQVRFGLPRADGRSGNWERWNDQVTVKLPAPYTPGNFAALLDPDRAGLIVEWTTPGNVAATDEVTYEIRRWQNTGRPNWASGQIRRPADQS